MDASGSEAKRAEHALLPGQPRSTVWRWVSFASIHHHLLALLAHHGDSGAQVYLFLRPGTGDGGLRIWRHPLHQTGELARPRPPLAVATLRFGSILTCPPSLNASVSHRTPSPLSRTRFRRCRRPRTACSSSPSTVTASPTSPACGRSRRTTFPPGLSSRSRFASTRL